MKRAVIIILSSLLLAACEPASVTSGRRTYELYFRKVLKDPDSFKVYDEMVEPIDDHSAMWTIDYGARNGYGGMVRRTVTFKTTAGLIDIDGKLVDVSDL